MNAETLARALGGLRTGSHWMAPCPSHEDGNPSLSIKNAYDDKVLVHCHAGCDQFAVIRALRSRGLWHDVIDRYQRTTAGQSLSADKAPPPQSSSNRTRTALRLWTAAQPARNTLIATYLRSRGICLPVPAACRFHPKLKGPDGGSWPGMVALVVRGHTGEPLAIHRTFLSRDCTGKAPITPQKMMLGPCRGGAVRLAVPTGSLMVGEGIESCLAVMQATNLPAWAALSTSGLRTLRLPEEIDEVIILADGDDPGEAAALDAAGRWMCEGRTVRIARPPRGMDFNDVLLGVHTSAQEDEA